MPAPRKPATPPAKAAAPRAPRTSTRPTVPSDAGGPGRKASLKSAPKVRVRPEDVNKGLAAKKGPVSQFLAHHYRHFNAAALDRRGQGLRGAPRRAAARCS